jgi:hypothetical protein
MSEDGQRFVVSVWTDEVKKVGKAYEYVLCPVRDRRVRAEGYDGDSKLGAQELSRLARLAIDQRCECYGLLLTAEDKEADTRKVKHVNTEVLYVMKLHIDAEERVVASLDRKIAFDAVRIKSPTRRTAVDP